MNEYELGKRDIERCGYPECMQQTAYDMLKLKHDDYWRGMVDAYSDYLARKVLGQ